MKSLGRHGRRLPRHDRAALRERERTGHGQHLDVSLYNSAPVLGAWAARIPQGFDEYDVVALGIAAYTSAVAIEELERRGVTPDKGRIVVTGATGGCSSFAIDMLAGLGYSVVASTGKGAETGYLKSIDAAEVVGRDGLTTGDKPITTWSPRLALG